MKLPRSGGGKLGLEVIELADHERPPMIRIPEYLEKRRTAGPAAPIGSEVVIAVSVDSVTLEPTIPVEP
jgi:hypothetical protein